MERVRRWQWVLIGLTVGFALAEARRLAGTDWIKFGVGFDDQAVFERSLTQETGGVRHFRDLTVYPIHVHTGADRRLVHVVRGSFYDGTPTRAGDEVKAVWETRSFLAPYPYRPLTAPQEATDGPTPPRGVADYLSTLPGVRYRYAWWHDPGRARAFYATGGVVLIGLLWPTVINLLVYGQLRRPTDARAAKQSPAHSEQMPAAAAAPAPAALDPLLAALQAELSADVVATAVPGVGSGAGSPAPALARLAPPAPAGAAAAAPNGEAKAFGADAGDYYPTEVHGRDKRRRA